MGRSAHPHYLIIPRDKGSSTKIPAKGCSLLILRAWGIHRCVLQDGIVSTSWRPLHRKDNVHYNLEVTHTVDLQEPIAFSSRLRRQWRDGFSKLRSLPGLSILFTKEDLTTVFTCILLIFTILLSPCMFTHKRGHPKNLLSLVVFNKVPPPTKNVKKQ